MKAHDQLEDELQSLCCYALYWSQSRAGVGNHPHRPARLLLTRDMWRWKAVLLNGVPAIRVFGGFAYYGFLEKDLGREGGQRAPRGRILLWLR